jgi:hypothetical protein
MLIDSSDGALWFVGDLSDSWVVSIAEVLARCTSIVQVHCPGEVPECPYDLARPPRLVIVHRQRITAADAQRLRGYRDAKTPSAAPAIILCVSPYVRYDELERWSSLANHVLFEATAGDVLPRHVARVVEGREGRIARVNPTVFGIEVAGRNRHLCEGLVQACVTAGYRAVAVDDLDAARGVGAKPSNPPAAERALTIWDVPVLEPDWAERLELRTRSTGPVIALFGFADREVVATAKARGAPADQSQSTNGRCTCASSRLIGCRHVRAGASSNKIQPPRRYRGQITIESLQYPDIRTRRSRKCRMASRSSNRCDQ